MRIFIKITILFLIILAAASFWLWREADSFLNTPPQAKGIDIPFDVPPGANLRQIAASLAEKGLITDARKFQWLARYKELGNRIQAGRFNLNSGWLPEQVLEQLANGKPVLYRITIPEGLTWWQTGRLLEDAGLARFDDFKNVIMDPAFLNHYGIPFSTAEGFLMPDTYLLKKPDTPMPPPDATPANSEEEAAFAQWAAQARSVAGRLVDNFWRKSAQLWPPNGEGAQNSRPSRNDLKKWIILASIVEKETGRDSERQRIAGVYANRLGKNMLLQADPTVIYGLGPDFRGPLLRSHLDNSANPYNTYQNAGLPPGPISSFGTAALKAAINPEKHDFLYFVAVTDGGEHTFSRTLNEHNIAAREYRRQKKGAQ